VWRSRIVVACVSNRTSCSRILRYRQRSSAPARSSPPLAGSLGDCRVDTLFTLRWPVPRADSFTVPEAKLGKSGQRWHCGIAGRDDAGARTLIVVRLGYAGWSLRGGEVRRRSRHLGRDLRFIAAGGRDVQRRDSRLYAAGNRCAGVG
jgi:hypothetical protein